MRDGSETAAGSARKAHARGPRLGAWCRLALALNKELAPKGVHVGTVTVASAIQPGTPFSPEWIAEAFWRMREDSAGAKPAEVVFKGDAAAA